MALEALVVLEAQAEQEEQEVPAEPEVLVVLAALEVIYSHIYQQFYATIIYIF